MACKRLDGAARLLDEAVAASDPGGAVIAGTSEAAQFERALNAAGEAFGNAHFDLQRAKEVARDVDRRLPRA